MTYWRLHEPLPSKPLINLNVVDKLSELFSNVAGRRLRVAVTPTKQRLANWGNIIKASKNQSIDSMEIEIELGRALLESDTTAATNLLSMYKVVLNSENLDQPHVLRTTRALFGVMAYLDDIRILSHWSSRYRGTTAYIKNIWQRQYTQDEYCWRGDSLYELINFSKEERYSKARQGVQLGAYSDVLYHTVELVKDITRKSKESSSPVTELVNWAFAVSNSAFLHHSHNWILDKLHPEDTSLAANYAPSKEEERKRLEERMKELSKASAGTSTYAHSLNHKKINGKPDEWLEAQSSKSLERFFRDIQLKYRNSLEDVGTDIDLIPAVQNRLSKKQGPIYNVPQLYSGFYVVLLVDASSSMVGPRRQQADVLLSTLHTSLSKVPHADHTLFYYSEENTGQLEILEAKRPLKNLNKYIYPGSTPTTEALTFVRQHMQDRIGYKVLIHLTDGHPNEITAWSDDQDHPCLLECRQLSRQGVRKHHFLIDDSRSTLSEKYVRKSFGSSREWTYVDLDTMSSQIINALRREFSYYASL